MDPGADGWPFTDGRSLRGRLGMVCAAAHKYRPQDADQVDEVTGSGITSCIWPCTLLIRAAGTLTVTGCPAFMLDTEFSGTPLTATSPKTTPARPRGTAAWLLTRMALSQVIADGGARTVLRASHVYELLRPGQQPLPGVIADPVITFASAATLEHAVESGRVPPGTYGVMYDPEAWSFTPLSEQRNPVAAADRAAAAAHAHGLRFVVAPALNLTTILARGCGPRWQAFLDLGLVGKMAEVADVVELQAQSLERDTATYAAFVRAATSQADAARPGITVLAGLSTNPPGDPVNTQHLMSVIQATRSVVDGYWLNIPGQGPRCPTCNAPRPDIAIQTLKQLG
jgi:hypothetical protein